MKKTVFSTIGFLAATVCKAQTEVEMADSLRQNGKIYVVVGVLLIIFIGITVYLITIDRRLRKQENKD
jgi:uncharacterized membrane protein